MPRHATSLMERSAAENKRTLDAALRDYRKPGSGADPQHAVFMRRNADEAKKFSLFRFITSKETGTGRFGAQRPEERRDSIKALDTSPMPEKAYFDPFSMKTIHPINVREGEAPVASAADDALAGQIEDDFVERVDSEIEAAQKNDFEKPLRGRNSELALAEAVEVGTDERQNGPEKKLSYEGLVRSLNAGRSFIPDSPVIEDIPDSFSIEVIVDQPAPKYTQEFGEFRAKKTQGVWEQVKGWFRKTFNTETPEEKKKRESDRLKEVYKEYLDTLPEYRDVLWRHRADAILHGRAYKPGEDPDLQEVAGDVKKAAATSGYGHAIVRMNARKYGVTLSRYSFMFGSTSNPGMAGAVVGSVSNPARTHEGKKKGEFDISYQDYLKAAAKIRGTIGSMRSYSLLGYNCTSFAIEIAQAAGVRFNDEDTSSSMMTFRHHSQRVDSPYLLGRKLEEADTRSPAYKTDKARARVEQAAATNKIGTTIYALYKQPMMDSAIIQRIDRLNLYPHATLEERVDRILDSVIEKGAKVDHDIPLFSSKSGREADKEINEAMANRIMGRKSVFQGCSSEQEYIEYLMGNDELMARNICYDLRSEGFFDNVFGRELTSGGTKDYVSIFARTGIYAKHFMGLSGEEAMQRASEFLGTIISRQQSLRRQVVIAVSNRVTYSDMIQGIEDLVGSVDLKMLGERLLYNDRLLEDFVTKYNIPLPEIPKEPEPEAEKEEAGPAAAAAAAPVATAAPTTAVSAEAQKRKVPVQRKVVKSIIDTEVNPGHIQDIVQALDEGAAAERFIEAFSAYGIRIYEVKRAQILQFLANLLEERNVRVDIARRYRSIMTARSMEDKVDEFRLLIEDITSHFGNSELQRFCDKCEIY